MNLTSALYGRVLENQARRVSDNRRPNQARKSELLMRRAEFYGTEGNSACNLLRADARNPIQAEIKSKVASVKEGITSGPNLHLIQPKWGQ